MRAALASCALALLAGCGGGETKLGRARLAEADAIDPAPAGPVVELPPPPPQPPGEPVNPKPPPIEIPAGVAGPVRVAADRDVPYFHVADAAERISAAGGQPALIVAKRGKLGALPRPSVAREESIRLVAYSDGRACVSPPGVEEATCVIRDGGKHVDRAFTRELVRKARKEYGLTSVRVVLSPTLSWADAVRAIDGARTCCAEPMDVSVEMLLP